MEDICSWKKTYLPMFIVRLLSCLWNKLSQLISLESMDGFLCKKHGKTFAREKDIPAHVYRSIAQLFMKQTWNYFYWINRGRLCEYSLVILQTFEVNRHPRLSCEVENDKSDPFNPLTMYRQYIDGFSKFKNAIAQEPLHQSLSFKHIKCSLGAGL